MENFIQILGIKNIIIYFLIINLLGFLVMGIDKWKSKNGKWRISENTLLMFTFLGGGIGSILGMYLFRHKTKKNKFKIGIPAVLILETILIIYLFWIF